MRSRYTHEGQLDHHAHNEHELFHRADQALERQRRMDHLARVDEHSAAIGFSAPVGKDLGFPLTASLPPASAAMPKMPHEEIAERIALKPPSLTTPQTNLAWPPRPNASGTGHSHGFRSRK